MDSRKNIIWSNYVQGPKTLYYSRKLRFDDRFAGQYKALFDPEGKYGQHDTRTVPVSHKSLKILEVGCGPGALAGALHRWHPDAEITGIDRDSEFIRFAKEHEDGITFLEGDATALPFADRSFDVVISNTVSEHIEPSRFYGEQLRVLKEDGICLVLSSRRGITISADCLAMSEKEQKFWDKVQQYDDTMDKYDIGKYPVNEAEAPAVMERYGFRKIRTGFVTIDLTPDNAGYPAEFAHKIIEADRASELERVDSVRRTMPEQFDMEEIEEMKRLVNVKYDTRTAQYDRGERQWDTCVSVIMVIRGNRCPE